jgi:hypothetical protein
MFSLSEIHLAAKIWYGATDMDSCSLAENRLNRGERVSKYNDWQELEGDFEERAAILEFDGGRSKREAEGVAAQGLGFKNKSEFKQYIQALKAGLFKNV